MTRAAVVIVIGLAVTLGGCGPGPAPVVAEDRTFADRVAPGLPERVPVARKSGSDTVPIAPRAALIGEATVLSEWRKADNRYTCAPLALAGDGGGGGTPRRANFSGGWAVAFDLPDLRSAYGVAGTGTADGDDQAAEVHRQRLLAQWPSFRDLAGLPPPSFAGYGLSGAQPYPDTNPAGAGLHSLAYVRVGGQSCTYNVWSRISRNHLETLLANLRIVPQG